MIEIPMSQSLSLKKLCDGVDPGSSKDIGMPLWLFQGDVEED